MAPDFNYMYFIFDAHLISINVSSMNYVHLQVKVSYTIKNVLTSTYLKHETANSHKQQLTASTLHTFTFIAN